MKNEEETLFGIWNSFRNISENICSFPYPLLGDPSQEDVAVVLTLHGMNDRSYGWLLKEPIPNIFQISVDRISHGLSSSVPAGAKRFEFKDGCGDFLEVKPFQGDAWILNWITPKFWEARPRLYRRRFLQENIRWKALDEIYKIYMLLHRSDLIISEKVHQFGGAFSTLEMLKSFGDFWRKKLENGAKECIV